MKNRLCKYDIELFNKICDAKDFPNILGTDNNKLDSVWCRNYKEVIKFQTSIEIVGTESNCSENENYLTNFYMNITPEQAEKIIKELQRVLKNRGKK